MNWHIARADAAMNRVAHRGDAEVVPKGAEVMLLLVERHPYQERCGMNEDQWAGNWKQFKGKIREQWGKLTDDDLDIVAGKRDQFLGRLQERQGLAKEEAERQLQEWQNRNPDFRFDK